MKEYKLQYKNPVTGEIEDVMLAQPSFYMDNFNRDSVTCCNSVGIENSSSSGFKYLSTNNFDKDHTLIYSLQAETTDIWDAIKKLSEKMEQITESAKKAGEGIRSLTDGLSGYGYRYHRSDYGTLCFSPSNYAQVLENEYNKKIRVD